jgi:hypothetical protein
MPMPQADEPLLCEQFRSCLLIPLHDTHKGWIALISLRNGTGISHCQNKTLSGTSELSPSLILRTDLRSIQWLSKSLWNNQCFLSFSFLFCAFLKEMRGRRGKRTAFRLGCKFNLSPQHKDGKKSPIRQKNF